MSKKLNIKGIIYYSLGFVIFMIPILMPVLVKPINEDYIPREFGPIGSVANLIISIVFLVCWGDYSLKISDYILSDHKSRKLKKELRRLREARVFSCSDIDAAPRAEKLLLYRIYSEEINDIEIELHLGSTYSDKLKDLKDDLTFWRGLAERLLIDHDINMFHVKGTYVGYMREINKIELKINELNSKSKKI